MNSECLMAGIKTAGIVLSVREGRLIVDAPEGALTPELRQMLADHKSKLITILSTPGSGDGEPQNQGSPQGSPPRTRLNAGKGEPGEPGEPFSTPRTPPRANNYARVGGIEAGKGSPGSPGSPNQAQSGIHNGEPDGEPLKEGSPLPFPLCLGGYCYHARNGICDYDRWKGIGPAIPLAEGQNYCPMIYRIDD